MKYQYTNPIMKQVAQYCDKGHWPICETADSRIFISMPLRNEAGYIIRSYLKETIKEAQQSIGVSYQDNQDTQPTKIIGFWHPPTPHFEVGDMVRVYNGYDKVEGGVWTIEDYEDATNVGIVANGGVLTKSIYQLEPVLDSQPLELTLEEIAEKFGTTADNIKIKK
jgi:hypothetical protein